MTNRVRNTADIHPLELLIGAFEDQRPGRRPGQSIEDMEARGQRELAESDQLPTDCPPEDKAKLEAAGVKFGAPCAGDPIFCDVILPEGWEVKPTDHSMWSDLVDDKGVKRASIFYKAAFYDRSAFMRAARDE